MVTSSLLYPMLPDPNAPVLRDPNAPTPMLPVSSVDAGKCYHHDHDFWRIYAIVRPFIVVGDKTSHGGTVCGGAATTTTGDRQIARVGDPVSCPKEGHGPEVIITGDPTIIIDGKPAARHGDKTSCGASLISSQSMTGVDNVPGPAGAAVASSSEAAGAGQAANLVQADDDGAPVSGENHSYESVSEIDHDKWDIAGEISEGNSIAIDSDHGIIIQPTSIAGPLPTNQFGYYVTQRPLNADGSLQDVAAPADWFEEKFYSSGFTGFADTSGLKYTARPGPGGNRWYIKFHPQESAHGNARSATLVIYTPADH